MIVHLMYYLISSLFFDISLSYYTNLYSSIICCLFSGDMYLSYCMFVSFSLAFECNIFKWLVILLTVLLPITSRFCSFLTCSLWSIYYYIYFRYFTAIKKFLTLLIAHVFSNFSCMRTNVFSKRQKSISFYVYIIC